MRKARKWQRVVGLANASGDDELAERWSNVWLFNFGVWLPCGRPVGRGFVPSLAEKARRILPELRDLIRGLGDGATEAQRRAAMRVYRDHERHQGGDWERRPPAYVTALEEKKRSLEADLEQKNRAGALAPRRAKILRDLRTKSVRKSDWLTRYPDVIDPIICKMILEPAHGCVPVRVCRQCGKFFVRSGRRKFCSASCKAKYWRRKFQMSPAERRDYQVEYRAEELLRERGPEAVRERMRKTAHRKMATARRRQILDILRGVLR